MPPPLSTMTTNDESVRRRLSAVKNGFPSALQNEDELMTFKTSWTALLDLVSKCSENLGEETHLMVHSFAQTVTTVSTALLEGQLATDTVLEKFEQDLARITNVDFKRLSIQDDEAKPQPEYIESCYVWLLKNLHNPYPSRKLRAQIAAQINGCESVLDAWFIDARRRIGWNEIRRNYFDTRADMVKAATRFFKPKSCTIRAGPYYRFPSVETTMADGLGYDVDFMNMKARAEALYPHKVFPTSLASSVPSSSKLYARQVLGSLDSSPGSTADHSQMQIPCVLTNAISRKRRNLDGDIERGVPSKRSRTTIPPMNDTGSASSIECPSPPTHVPGVMSRSVTPFVLKDSGLQMAGRNNRKRRCSDASDYDSDSSHIRSLPRRRINEVSTLNEALTAGQGIQKVFTSNNASLDPSLSVSELHPLPTSKRKRRLSDSLDDRPRKHPHHGALMTPRLQTVSNPLPVPYLCSALEDTLATPSADIITSSKAAEHDNLHVECFDYDVVSNGKFSQVNSKLHNPDRLSESGSIPPFTPKVLPPLESSLSMDDFIPLSPSELVLATVGQLSLPSCDDLFSDKHEAANCIVPKACQDHSFSMDHQLSFTLDQNIGQMLVNNTIFPIRSSDINPLDLIYPPIVAEHSNMVTNCIVGHSGKMLSAPSLDNAAITSLALQEIENLQVQVQMYRTRLAQAGVSIFE